MQRIGAVVGDEIRFVDLPPHDEEVVPGVRWGDASVLLTPAWIAKQAHIRRLKGEYDGLFEARRNSLAEDVVFCLLGGFGIRAEVAIAAYRALSDAGLFRTGLAEANILEVLRGRLDVDGKSIRYRFPAGRSRYIGAALRRLDTEAAPKSPLALRDYLLEFPGIGRKTASYIVRNHLGSDDVAILDIHVILAGQIACMFPDSVRLPNDYAKLETIFLRFARAAMLPASCLDLTVWELMRQLSPRQKEAARKLNKTHLLAGISSPLYVEELLGRS